MHTKASWLLLVLVYSFAGCGDRDKSLQASVNVVDVAPLGDDLAYVQSDGMVQRLNVLAANPEPRTVKVPTTTAPRLVVKRPTSELEPVDELLIVSDGKTDQFGQELQPPALTAMTGDGSRRVYTLKDRGQQMRISDDGQIAILFNDPTYDERTSLLSNPGEVAIVDLGQQQQDGKNPTIRNLDTVGGPPNSVEFPALTVDGSTRRFALFTFPNGVSLIDLANSTEPGHKLDLTAWVSAGAVSPSAGFAIAADPNGNEIFLKSNGSKFVEVISVSAAVDGGVDVSLKQLTVGSVAPGAISVFSNENGTQLVATLGGALALVDTEEDSVTTATLSHSANLIHMFRAKSPDDPQVSQRALVYAPGETRATFVDLESLPYEHERALTMVEFGEPISMIREIEFLSGRVLVFLSGGGVDILDLTTRHWVPIDSPVALNLVVADRERGRVWVSAGGDKRLAYMDFGTDANSGTLTVPNSVQLDDTVQKFFRLGTADSAKVAVTHYPSGGAVTLLDALKPERATAKRLEGFLYSDVL